ncbi:hypothetical protein [Aquibacillus koreensis]|uniref:hypothetical protein n=1 Tax=Aquibacillus koreensis TaxID=279446 RepID=UPI00233FF060|nr:hypothetical protein [Aquibacillus koreensis]
MQLLAEQVKLATLLQEQHGLKIHSEALFASELAEAVPAEREPISLVERVGDLLQYIDTTHKGMEILSFD